MLLDLLQLLVRELSALLHLCQLVNLLLGQMRLDLAQVLLALGGGRALLFLLLLGRCLCIFAFLVH